MENKCICCGEVIPEGRQICLKCEKGNSTITLKDLEPLSNTEKEMVSRLGNEKEAVMAILKRRTFLRENTEYIGSLYKEITQGRYAPRNEKETATMPILYEEDI